jgi:DNA-binding GntR family transcriptional regulator
MTELLSPNLRRAPLRDQIYMILVEQVTSGVLAPGSRLRDASVAASLGVSRTPVREALMRLEREGFLLADHNRGFFVRGFDEHEICETYPLVWTLEVLALRDGFPPSPELLSRLEALNRSMGSTKVSAAELSRLDHEWHAALVAASTNQRLGTIISPLKAAIQRYERAYMRSRQDVRASVEEHEQIRKALAGGKVDTAADRLERHWRRGMEALLRRQRVGASDGHA